MAAAAAAGALFAAGALQAHAGQVQSGFTVSVRAVPADALAACSLASGADSVRIACAPPNMPVTLPTSAPVLAAPVVQPEIGLSDGPAGDPFQALRRDEEARGPGGDDGLRSFLSLVVDRAARVQSPTRFGEYSSRRVSVGEYEYVEMTVSW